MKARFMGSVPLAMAVVALTVSSGCQTPEAPERTPSAGVVGEEAAPVVAATEGNVMVAFELDDEVTVGALQLDIDYNGASGRFVGAGDDVRCEALVTGALSSFNNVESAGTLRAAFVAVNGFTGPMRFLVCEFEGEASAEDFLVEVQDASAPDLVELGAPAIKVVVER